MKTKKFVSALLASAVALSLVAGCGGGDKKKADEKKPAAAAGAVKVGVFLPLTGDNAAGGELELRGIKLANKIRKSTAKRLNWSLQTTNPIKQNLPT